MALAARATGEVAAPVPADDGADAVALRRLAWRMRRGMLENDLILRRGLGMAGGEPLALPEGERGALDALLEMPDGRLLEVLLGREPAPAAPGMEQLLGRLRGA